MSSVQTKTLITLTLKLPDLEVDVTKEVTLEQLRRINSQIARLYEDSNTILGKILVSTHSSYELRSALYTERVKVAWNWIKVQTKPFDTNELSEATGIPRTACYPILTELVTKKLIETRRIGRSMSWIVIQPKNTIKPTLPGGIDIETPEQTKFREESAERKASELQARLDSR